MYEKQANYAKLDESYEKLFAECRRCPSQTLAVGCYELCGTLHHEAISVDAYVFKLNVKA